MRDNNEVADCDATVNAGATSPRLPRGTGNTALIAAHGRRTSPTLTGAAATPAARRSSVDDRRRRGCDGVTVHRSRATTRSPEDSSTIRVNGAGNIDAGERRTAITNDGTFTATVDGHGGQRRRSTSPPATCADFSRDRRHYAGTGGVGGTRWFGQDAGVLELSGPDRFGSVQLRERHRHRPAWPTPSTWSRTPRVSKPR